MAKAQVAVRLGSEGKAELQRDFADVGAAGEASASRATRAYEKAAQDIEAAQRRQTAAANKLVALMPADQRSKAGFMSDAASMPSTQMFRDFQAQQALYRQQAEALRSSLDPARAAQQRYNAEMSIAKTLIASGTITLDEFCGKLRQERQLLDQSTQERLKNTASYGAMRAGMQTAGFQVQDFLVQVQGGTSALRAFSQQAPQFIGSLQMMTYGAEQGTGKFAAFARIMGGWQGVVLGIAIPAAAMLVEKLLDTSDAHKKAEEATKKHKDAIDALNQTARDSIKTAEDRARALYITAEAERQNAVAAERNFQTQLAAAKAEAEKKQINTPRVTARGDVINPAFVRITQEIEQLEAALRASQERVATQTTTATIMMGQYQRTIIDQMMTPRGRAERNFDRQINAAIANGDGAEAIARLTRAREAELKRIDEAEAALKKSGSARDQEAASVSQVTRLIVEAFGGTVTSGKRNADENARAGGSKTSYHLRGQAIDFVPAGGMGSITKDEIRAVAEAAGLTVKEILGPGDKNHSDHYHLAWQGGKTDIASGRITAGIQAKEDREAERTEIKRNEWLNDQMADIRKKNADWGKDEVAKMKEVSDFMRQERADTAANTALLNVEWEMRGKSRQEIERALALRQYQLDIERDMPRLTAEQVEELVKAKGAQLDWAQTVEMQRSYFENLRRSGEDAIDRLFDPSSAETWGQRIKGVLNDLLNEMVRMAAINPLKNMLFGSGLPTLFGGGGLLSFLGGKGGSAIGHESTPAGRMLIGENGPEYVDMPAGAKVFTASESRRMAANDNRSGGPVNVNVYANDAVLAETVRGWVAQGVAIAIERGSTQGANLAASEARYNGFRSLEGR
jgi:hypothetical protein